MEILNLLKGNEQRRTEETWARYMDLLEAKSHDARSVAELEQCMKALGKSADDAEADLRTLRTVRENQRLIVDGSGLGDQEQQARAARDKYRQETQDLVRQREAEWERLDRVYRVLGNRQTSAQQGERRIAELRQEHPELLNAAIKDPA